MPDPERALMATDILDRLKTVYGVERDADLARFLSLTPSAVSTWRRRNTLDLNLIVVKCLTTPTKLLRVVNLHWLVTGQGESTFETVRSAYLDAITNVDEDLSLSAVEGKVRQKLRASKL